MGGKRIKNTEILVQKYIKYRNVRCKISRITKYWEPTIPKKKNDITRYLRNRDISGRFPHATLIVYIYDESVINVSHKL